MLLSACGGAFLSTEVTAAFIHTPDWLHSWDYTLLKSAHNHFNQFGYLMVLFGITLPYSKIPLKYKQAQTIGMIAGCVGMGPCMIWKAAVGVSDTNHITSVVIGILVSAALCALATHFAGLMAKYLEKS